MRIESTMSRKKNLNSTIKKKQAKEEKDENKASTETESIELSDELKLLNKLLNATSNQFIPYPFYFTNAAEKNIKQARMISKNIQNQAESMAVFLNFLMVYDMVIDLATKNHMNEIQWIPQTTNELLDESEKWLFENLHNCYLRNRKSIDAISLMISHYITEKQNNPITMTDKKKCADFINYQLNGNTTQQNNKIKHEIDSFIKYFVTQNERTSPT